MKSDLKAETCGLNRWLTISLLIVFVLLYKLNRIEGAECTMAQQLLDPAVRSNYIATVENNKLPKSAAICGTPYIPAASGQQTLIDPISMECLSCHDGTIGRNVYYKIVKNAVPETTDVLVLQITHSAGSDVVTTQATGTIDTGSVNSRKSHAIGTDFTRYNCNPGFNSWASLPDEMVLMNGEISCATCHNLLGTNRLYLSGDMFQSGLCFACHKK